MQAFDEPVVEHFRDQATEIIRIELSDEALAAMCAYFESYFHLDVHGRPIPLGDGYYEARGDYHAFSNSNHWAARALRQAGCPITPAHAITAGNVMYQARDFGEVVWRR